MLGAIEEAAELWGALWRSEGEGGHLALPVVEGLRHGLVRGHLAISASTDGTSLSLEIVDRELRLNRSAVFILVLGALGGLTVVLWPLSPRILQLAPLGVVLAIAAWLMVVSRLRSSGVDQFLDLVSELAEGAEDPDTPA